MRGSPKARAEGKHRESSCGSETGRDERKRTESRVRRNGREARETGWNGSGGARKLKGGGAAPKKTYCEGETGRERKGRNRGQVAGTGGEADERKWIGRGKTESESTR